MKNKNFDENRKLFFNCFPGVKYFQTFPDNKEKKSKINLTRQVCIKENQYPVDGDIDLNEKIMPYNIINGLDILNDAGAGIFMTVAETDGNGRKKANITKIRAVYADFDKNGVLPKFESRPSMIVETSLNKWHVYWLTAIADENYNVPLASFKPMQEAIANKYNSDPLVKDISRVMRCPGWYHNKSEPFLSRIVDYTGERFEFGLLVEMFPPQPVEQWSAKKWQPEPSLNDSEFTGKRGVSKPGRNSHIIKCLGGAKRRGLSWAAIENEAYLEGAACTPQLKQSEIRAILRSFRRY